MQLIAKPKTLAERIVNAMLEHLYGPRGADWWIKAASPEVRQQLIDGFVKVVQKELDKRER